MTKNMFSDYINDSIPDRVKAVESIGQTDQEILDSYYETLHTLEIVKINDICKDGNLATSVCVRCMAKFCLLCETESTCLDTLDSLYVQSVNR